MLASRRETQPEDASEPGIVGIHLRWTGHPPSWWECRGNMGDKRVCPCNKSIPLEESVSWALRVLVNSCIPRSWGCAGTAAATAGGEDMQGVPGSSRICSLRALWPLSLY